MSITPRCFIVTQSSYLTFRFGDTAANCGALTPQDKSIARQQVCDSKIKGLSKVPLMKTKPRSTTPPPEWPVTKNMNIKLDGEALRWTAITLSLQHRCFADTHHNILIVT